MILALALGGLGLGAAAAPLTTAEEVSPGRVLAAARGVEITMRDWEEFLAGESGQQMLASRFQSESQAEGAARSALLQLLLQRMAEREAQDHRLLESARGTATLALAEREALADWVEHARLPREIEVTEEEISEEFEARREEFEQPDSLQFQQIFLSFRGLSSEEIEAKRALAAEIVAELRDDPARISELAQEHSDSETTPKDRILGPIRPDQILPELAEPLWQLQEGEVSDPLPSPFGLHIFRVVQRLSGQRPPDVVRTSLRQRLVRERVQERIDAILAEASEELGLEMPPLPDEIEGDTPILGGAVTLTGAELAEVHDLDLTDVAQRERAVALARRAQRGAALALWARAQGWDEDPEAQRTLEQTRERIRDHLVWRHRAEQQPPPSEEEVRFLYESASPEFTTPDRALVRVLELRPARRAERGQRFSLLAILDQAEELRRRWEQGEPFEDLVRAHSTADDAAVGGEPRWVEPRGRDAAMFSSVATLATGEVSAPVRLEDGYLLVEVLGKEAGRQRSFEEVAPEIRRDLERRRNRSFRRRWTEELRGEVAWDLPPALFSRFTIEAASPEAVTSRPASP